VPALYIWATTGRPLLNPWKWYIEWGVVNVGTALVERSEIHFLSGWLSALGLGLQVSNFHKKWKAEVSRP